MPDPIEPRRFQQDVADMLVSGTMAGLPEYLGINTVGCGPAYLVAELEVRADLLNPFGTLHGGVVTSLVDHVLGAVLYPVIEPGAWAATTEFKVNLTAPVSSGLLQARAAIVSMTRQTAVVSVEVDNDGRLCALAQGTVLTVPPRTPSSS